MFESWQSGVYVIRNTVNGKVYVGSAVNLEKRKRQHFQNLKGNYHYNVYLQAAFNKYGESAFEFAVLALVPEKERLLDVEQEFIDFHDAANRTHGYNSRPKASSNLGRKARPETLECMRLANLGKKQSPELIEKRIAPLRGRPLSVAHKAAIGKKNAGRNRRDMIGRAKGGALPRFDLDSVMRMRADRTSGMTYRAIADKHGCSIGTAHFAINGTGDFYRQCA